MDDVRGVRRGDGLRREELLVGEQAFEAGALGGGIVSVGAIAGQAL